MLDTFDKADSCPGSVSECVCNRRLIVVVTVASNTFAHARSTLSVKLHAQDLVL